MTTDVLENLSPEILVADYERYKMQRISGRSLATANWVTVLAHPCEAYALYMRTVPPEKRLPMKESLGMLFSEGDDQARAIKRDLLDMGYDVEGAEGQMAWKTYQITGRQDLKIRHVHAKRSVYAELKSCSPYTYTSLNSPADVREHKFEFIAKWYRQVALYMVLKSVDRYWLILKNKSTGQIKVIEFLLGDIELRIAEEMLKKAERVNQLVQIGQMPSAKEKISSSDLCPECEFFDVCLPDIDFGKRVDFLSQEQAAEMQKKLERWAEIKPIGKEFKDIDEELKDEVKELCADRSAPNILIGDWLATVKASEVAAEKEPRKGYTKHVVTFSKISKKQDDREDIRRK
jgi:hypothetical protein